VSAAEQRRLVDELQLDWDRYVKVEVTEALVIEAADLAERHRLRAYDALHLASSLALGARAGEPPTFACWDDALNTAARREGLIVLRQRR
jgi:uncharacterized protein